MPFKETKEGQTHSFNDGCGEKAHNSMTFKDQLEVILDEQFPKGKSEDRGAALVLFDHAVRLHKKEIERVKLLRAEVGSDDKTHVVNISL